MGKTFLPGKTIADFFDRTDTVYFRQASPATEVAFLRQYARTV
jgi:hypothetical protein